MVEATLQSPDRTVSQAMNFISPIRQVVRARYQSTSQTTRSQTTRGGAEVLKPKVHFRTKFGQRLRYASSSAVCVSVQSTPNISTLSTKCPNKSNFSMTSFQFLQIRSLSTLLLLAVRKIGLECRQCAASLWHRHRGAGGPGELFGVQYPRAQLPHRPLLAPHCAQTAPRAMSCSAPHSALLHPYCTQTAPAA